MIRAAELRSVITEKERFSTAIYTFRDKYFALPGDMDNAENFWRTNPNGCPDGGGTDGTCNGDGNGIIGTTQSMGCESQEFFRHLNLAGLYEGSSSVNPVSNCYGIATLGEHIPESKLSGAGWMAHHLPQITESGSWPGTMFYTNSYGNLLTLASGQSTNHLNIGPGVMSATDMWNIDTKIDDGIPYSGQLLTPRRHSNSTGAASPCVTSVDSGLAEYNVGGDNSNNECSLLFKMR